MSLTLETVVHAPRRGTYPQGYQATPIVIRRNSTPATVAIRRAVKRRPAPTTRTFLFEFAIEAGIAGIIAGGFVALQRVLWP